LQHVPAALIQDVLHVLDVQALGDVALGRGQRLGQ
jgi:hypothetical protein